MAEVEIAAVGPSGALAGSPVRTLVLVDSGADVTMLDEALATTLGLDLSNAPAEPVSGVGGSTTARRADVLVGVCGAWILAPVLFCAGQSQGLLGRAGVFESLGISFVHRHNTMLGVVL